MTDTLPTIAPHGAAPGRTRLPFVVPLLAVGTFLMCTTEYLVAGLLAEMSTDLGVSLSQVGLLITAFAVGMIIGAPMMAIATLRLPRRLTLVLALAVFAAGHVLAALSGSFTVVMIARVITALATGAFWAVAAVVATTAAGPAASTRALGVMMSGVGLATVIGVPLGSLAGQLLTWRGAFWALAILAVVAAVAIGRFVPADSDRVIPSIRGEIRALATGRLWLLLAGTVLITGAYMAAFSFISPLLTERIGFPLNTIPLVLVAFGIGSLIGTNVGGRLGHKRPVATFIGAGLAVAVILAVLIPASVNPVLTVVLVVALGMAGMTVPPVVTGLAVSYASHAPTLAAALAVAGFNAGIALGSAGAATALDSPLGAVGPSAVGVVMAAVGVLPLLILARKGRGDRKEVLA